MSRSTSTSRVRAISNRASWSRASARLTSRAARAASSSPSAMEARPRVRSSAASRVGFAALIASTISSAAGRVAGDEVALGEEHVDLLHVVGIRHRLELGAGFTEQLRNREVGVTAQHRDPSEVLQRGRRDVRLLRRAGDPQRLAEPRLGLFEVALVGEHLADVAGDERGFDRVAGPQPDLPTTLVQRDRVVPTAFVVREAAEVVEHLRLAVEVAELLVDLQRAGRVHRELGLAEQHVGPVEDEAGVGLGFEVPGADRFVDRVEARGDRLVEPALAGADRGVERGEAGAYARRPRPVGASSSRR